MRNSHPSLQRFVKSHYRLVVAFAMVLLLTALFLIPRAETVEQMVPSAATTTQAGEPLLAPVAEGVVPATIRIPSVNIEAFFEAPLGLNPDQTVEVPEAFDTVGWYQFGPVPGQLGPAVVLGHVDSYEGPAVFWALGRTEIGDIIEIERTDGSVAKFAITRLDRRPQDNFPTAEVYGDIDHAGLRLVTCSGTYDRGTLRYSHNLIVYAELVE